MIRSFGFVGVFLILTLSLGACYKGEISEISNVDSSENQLPGNGDAFGANINNNGVLPVWKRYRALEAGLSGALELPPENLCNEMGRYNCIKKVSLNLFGGNEPHHKLQYRAFDKPSLLTPLALERLLISACGERLKIDSKGNPAVFKHFDLKGGKPKADAIDKTATELYQRFHARNPSDKELSTIRSVAAKLSGDRAAMIMCTAIGSSAEILFN